METSQGSSWSNTSGELDTRFWMPDEGFPRVSASGNAGAISPGCLPSSGPCVKEFFFKQDCTDHSDRYQDRLEGTWKALDGKNKLAYFFPQWAIHLFQCDIIGTPCQGVF